MLKQQIKSLFKSNFLRNVLTLISGVGIAQLIPILLQTYLRRIFSPEDFGAFAVYMSMLGIITIISSLRYQLAIVIPKEDKEAANILILAFLINFSFFIILCTILLLFKTDIVILVNFPEKYSYWLYFLPISVFLFSVYDTMNYWLIRKKAFKSSSINKISRRSFEGMTQLGFGLARNPVGLILGDIIGNIANTLSGIIQIRKKGFSLNFFDKNILKEVIKKYIDFPKNSIPALLNTAGTLLPVIFINKFYSDNITGYFDLARMVLTVPGMLISLAISNVLFQNMSEKINQKKSIKKSFKSIFIVLLGISIIEIIVILNFGPSLFKFIFGNKGTISGIFSQTLVFAFAVKFVVSPLSFVFIAMRKIKVVSIWQISYFLSILSLIFFRSLKFANFINIYISIDILLYSIYFILIFITIKKYENIIKMN